ncbi:hypothetical protein CELL_01604 [Cellulomonas sp. T2.31MG-18]
MRTVPEHTLDRRVLNQPTYWITRRTKILPVAGMSPAHLRNVLAMLEGMARELHIAAISDLLIDDDSTGLRAEQTLYGLTGGCIATVSARAWLHATELVRAIDRELSRRDND